MKAASVGFVIASSSASGSASTDEGILPLFVTRLGTSETAATEAMALFTVGCYLTPVRGVPLDTAWGRFTTIVRLSVVHLVGNFPLSFVAADPRPWAGRGWRRRSQALGTEAPSPGCRPSAGTKSSAERQPGGGGGPLTACGGVSGEKDGTDGGGSGCGDGGGGAAAAAGAEKMTMDGPAATPLR